MSLAGRNPKGILTATINGMADPAERSAHFFESIRRHGLVRKGEVDLDTLSRLPRSKLIDTAKNLSELTAAANVQRERGTFAHSASLSLGGGRQYCRSAVCRTERAQALAQFGVLYSDRVYVKNFMADHVPHPGHRVTEDEDALRSAVYDDLVILNHLEPAFAQGTLVLFTPPLDLCPRCIAADAIGPDGTARLDEQLAALKRRLVDELDITVSFRNEMFHVSYRVPEEIFEHRGGAYDLATPTKGLAAMPYVMTRARKGERVRLSKSQVKTLGLHDTLARRVLDSISFDLACAQALGTSFLTDRPVEVDVLGALARDSSIERRNLIAERHLSTILPFVGDVGVSDLVRLRTEEEEAFVLFRKALTQAIDTYANRNDDFTEQDARAIYSDVIHPNLARLERKVSEAKARLVATPLRSAVAWTGAITFGIYSGLLPAELTAVATSLGLLKVGAELTQKIMEASSTDEPIKTDEFYFLWRMTKLRKRRAG